MLVESVDFLDRDNSAWRGLRWISQYTFNVFLFLFIRKQIRQSNSHVRIELFNADLQRRSNWKILVIFLNSTNSRFVVISIPSSTQNLQCFTPIQLKVCRYIPPPHPTQFCSYFTLRLTQVCSYFTHTLYTLNYLSILDLFRNIFSLTMLFF